MAAGAGCLCGAVRIEISGEPLMVRACWCRDCQYWAAGNATVNVVYRKTDLTITGEPAWYESDADSGNHMRRGFCSKCGSQLFSGGSAWPDILIVRAGAHDDPASVPPRMTIWTASAPSWAPIDPALPRFEGQPPPVG